MEKAKNAEEYIAIQQSAIARNPECGTSHYNLAVALLGQRKFEEAVLTLRALADVVHDPWTRAAIGRGDD